MDLLEQLKKENVTLKERLYAVHELNHPEVNAKLRTILHPDDLDHYAERASLRGETIQLRREKDEQAAEIQVFKTALEVATDRSNRMAAVALNLWAQLGHDPEKEPLPGVEP